MSAHCRSWRPGGQAHSPSHAPGTCRACWKPCHRRAVPGTARCTECFSLLAAHPDRDVRAALVAEPNLPASVIDLLATDNDFEVRTLAEQRIVSLVPAGRASTDFEDQW